MTLTDYQILLAVTLNYDLEVDIAAIRGRKPEDIHAEYVSRVVAWIRSLSEEERQEIVRRFKQSFADNIVRDSDDIVTNNAES